jgi:xylulokinase
VELSCEVIWDAFIQSLRRLHEDNGIKSHQILSIGAVAMCPALVALDETGSPLTGAIIFMDGRSVTETAELNARLGEQRIFERTANRLMAGAASLPGILWIKNHLPDIYRKTRYFAHLPSWLGMRMTGKLAMDYANAAGAGMFDIRNLCWAEDILEDVGIPVSMLPPLKQGVDILGGLNNDELISLGMRPDIPVAVGSGDTAGTALALGASTHGKAFLSLGTSAVLTSVRETKSFDGSLTNRAHVFRGLWISNGAMSCGGASLTWARNALCSREASDGNTFAEVEKQAASAPAGAGGVLFLPYLNGERNPIYDAEAKGLIFGIGLKTTRAELLRAVMEGVGFGLRQLMEINEASIGARLDNFCVAGGGGKSGLWLQIISDILGRKLEISAVRDAGAVGAAMLGGIAAEIITREFSVHEETKSIVYRPDANNSEIYAFAYERFIQLYPAVKHLYCRNTTSQSSI